MYGAAAVYDAVDFALPSAKSSGRSISSRLLQVQARRTSTSTLLAHIHLTLLQLDSGRSRPLSNALPSATAAFDGGISSDINGAVSDASCDELDIAANCPVDAPAAPSLRSTAVKAVPSLHTERVDCAEERELVDFGGLMKGMECSSSLIGHFTAAAQLERRVQWNDLMWPDDKAAWSSSPRHSYLQSCEKQNLMPHPRLLQIPHSNSSTLHPAAASSSRAPYALFAAAPQPQFVAPFGFVADQIFLGDAGLEASIPLIRSVLTAGGERGKQLHLKNVGITRAGVRLLGQQLQLWSSAPKSALQVVDIDFSGNTLGGGSVSDEALHRDPLAQSCSLYYLQPILHSQYLRRLSLCCCKCVYLPSVAFSFTTRLQAEGSRCACFTFGVVCVGGQEEAGCRRSVHAEFTAQQDGRHAAGCCKQRMAQA